MTLPTESVTFLFLWMQIRSCAVDTWYSQGTQGANAGNKTTARSKPQRRSKQNSTAARHKATSERIKRTALSRLEGLDGSECEAAAAAALVADLFNRASIASTQ